MRTLSLAVIFLAAAPSVFGQLESDTLTVQAAQSAPQLTPDQVVFSVSVTAGLETSFNQVLAALQGVGITAANLSFASGGFSGRSSLSWSFTLAVPFAKMKATIASLTSLEQSIGKNNSGVTLDFTVQGSRVSAELLESQPCSINDLVADAQAQAQKMAVAAGFTVGPIVAISEGALASPPTAFASFRLGNFSGTGVVIPNPA